MGRGERRVSSLLATLTFVLWTPLAVAGDATDQQLLARIFEGLGTRGEIAAIVPIATARLLAAPDAAPRDRRMLGRIVARTFDPARLERVARHAFLDTFDLAHARSAARWLARPEVRALQVALRDPAPGSCTPGEDAPLRALAIQRIERSADPWQRAERHARTVLRSLFDAADALLPETDRPARVERARIWSAERRGSEGRPAGGSTCGYAELPTETLVAMSEFIGSDTGRWLYGTMSRAVEAALEDAARRTARELIDQFDAREPEAPIRIAGSFRAG